MIDIDLMMNNVYGYWEFIYLNKVVQIIPIFEATPTASFSGLSLMKAFFCPSGLTRVLIDRGLTLWISLKAFLI